MALGIERPNRRKVIMWYLYRLRMASLMAIGRYLRTALPADPSLCRLGKQNTVPAELHKDRTVRSIYPMIRKVLFGRLPIINNDLIPILINEKIENFCA